MFFVYTPTYGYDERSELKVFDSLDQVKEFIEQDLKRNSDSTFKNTPDNYLVIEGQVRKVVPVRYAASVSIER